MAEIKCPMCGKSNPAELAVCQYCEARLKPLTDELSRSQPPIRPGEEPKEMDTGQLESTLPGWLREIRQQSRESAKEEPGRPPAQEKAGQQGDKADLLAGLQSQSGSEDEIPDWLSGLRSEGGQVGFEETSTDEDDIAALRSMLGEEASMSQEGKDSASPGWVSDVRASGEPVQNEPQPSSPDMDFKWEADFESEPELQERSAEDEKPFDTELPAWLQDTAKSQVDDSETELPAWLKDTAEETPIDESDTSLPKWLEADKPASLPEGEATEQATEGDLPAWLSSPGEEEPGEDRSPQDTGQPAARSTTDWLASLSEEDVEAESPLPADSAIKRTTDWLASLDQETPETVQPAAEGEMPDWLASIGKEAPQQSAQEETEEPATGGDLPGWLASLGKQSATREDDLSPGEEFAEPSQAAAEAELPDWLASISETPAEDEGPAEGLDRSIFAPETPAEDAGTASAFVDDEGKPISKEDVEAIFSMDFPDWLSDAGGVSEVDTTPPPVEAQADELSLAELPSWVQAMRPVESVISETERGTSREQPVEERGPLAGLRGVLPAVPGVGPSSKPKASSIKLQVSEDQQSSAALLENMLAEEVKPQEIFAPKVVLTQRLLRLAITTVFLSITAVAFFSGTNLNPIPGSVPLETKAVVDYVQNDLPADGAVLMVFDYEAARAGELEAAAAPVVDQMLALKVPRLSLISSTPTGSGLAERFMKLLHTDRDFVRNEKFINLGYLAGGPAGVQAFAGNPETTKQFSTTGESAWTTRVLQGVSGLSDFAAIFLLTDDVETARAWIEQTEGGRGEARLMVVSSAQSAPMILPYLRSGQVDGIVIGLENSAPIEQANNDRGGKARRYWDAYGFGLLTAVVMIAIGSLWSLVSGWRALRKENGEA